MFASERHVHHSILADMLQVSRSQSTYDVIVVGSGATGGWAAKELTEAA